MSRETPCHLPKLKFPVISANSQMRDGIGFEFGKSCTRSCETRKFVQAFQKSCQELMPD